MERLVLVLFSVATDRDAAAFFAGPPGFNNGRDLETRRLPAAA